MDLSSWRSFLGRRMLWVAGTKPIARLGSRCRTDVSSLLFFLLGSILFLELRVRIDRWLRGRRKILERLDAVGEPRKAKKIPRRSLSSENYLVWGETKVGVW